MSRAVEGMIKSMSDLRDCMESLALLAEGPLEAAEP